jgi:hypothetical protein
MPTRARFHSSVARIQPPDLQSALLGCTGNFAGALPLVERRLSKFEHSPEGGSTYAKWRRGAFIFYWSISLFGLAVILAAHFSHLPVQFAGN